jgi:adenylate cyclase, class 2
MHYEVEQKFPLVDPKSVQAQLTTLGATWHEPIRQVDSYFAHPARDFAKTDEALRIRRVGDANFVTYKGPKLDAVTKTRRELELPLAPGEAGYDLFAELLVALGFRRVADVRKTRRPGALVRNGLNVELALDGVDGVGEFLELEISATDESLDAARQMLAELAAELGLESSERRSYLELLLRGK